MKTNKNELTTLCKGWEKSLRHNSPFYLRQAYELGKRSLRRAKCYFCDKIKMCHVLDLAGRDDVPAQSFFVCPRCEKRHTDK